MCTDNGCLVLQLTQVRKNAYVAEAGEEYHPDRHRSCTIYAGTLVQQVCNSNASCTLLFLLLLFFPL